MSQRDRAWRRRVSRIVSHRDDEAREVIHHHKASPADKSHRAGKLTPVQAKRQDGMLTDEAADGWMSDPLPAPEISEIRPT